ncbi:S1C family serine protease [Pseudonocardia humida]|uniref:Trypsin-like peptidase domain-containing protein n=1 Tax=Pseudonocardia humida TaxID=2800819 RepID=A0ABT1AD46_9PSEU|nr:trypsin-like peptidase domain-containing protein [Pseudonocardia humida]MCO1660975.1 trypsin-like peptidase domain-containing protein [Pseudonocardia humida]
MSDEQREPGRETGTGPRPHQHPVPSHSGGPSTTTYPAYPPADSGYGTPGYAGPPPPRDPSWGENRVAAQPPRQNRPMAAVVTAALIAGLVGGGGGFAGAYALLDGGNSPAGSSLTTAPSANNAASTTPGTVAGAAQTATPSTVDIQVNLAQGTAEGSGIVLTADGNVLTNNHVVAGATGPITVTLADGTEYPATVVGTSPSYDLAVIKLQNASGLTPATLGSSADLQVGQQVVAIGSPQGLSGTVTTGIVSAFDRTVQVQGEDGSAVVYNGLQTDAPINQGNSGGALVNLQGQVVGINSAIATAGQSSGSIGLGFAIPIDQAKRVAQEILDTGTATKPVLGVRGNAAVQSPSGAGATLAEVDAGSPAASAGLQAGDVVTKVDDAAVDSFADLIARVGAHAPGDTVTLTVGEGPGARTVDVTLGSVPDEAATTSSGGQSENPFGNGGPFGGENGNPFGN